MNEVLRFLAFGLGVVAIILVVRFVRQHAPNIQYKYGKKEFELSMYAIAIAFVVMLVIVFIGAAYGFVLFVFSGNAAGLGLACLCTLVLVIAGFAAIDEFRSPINPSK